jgi:hypothetical protein
MGHRGSLIVLLAAACGPDAAVANDDADDTGDTGAGSTFADATGSPSDDTQGATTSDDADVTSATDDDDDDDDPGFDVGMVPDAGGPTFECEADELDVVVGCDAQARPNSFSPALQWSWDGSGAAMSQSVATPLVANLTDDNGDGAVDLCDIPDVVVLGYAGSWDDARLAVLDGATGSLHFEIPYPLLGRVMPALADIDGDGVVELVAAERVFNNNNGRLVAFSNEGELRWHGQAQFDSDFQGAISIADLDADGDVELMLGRHVIDHEGNLVWGLVDPTDWDISGTSADLDGDGELEVIVGPTAYHHDGEPYWEIEDILAFSPAHVADVDGDAEAEVVVVMSDELAIIQHDGDYEIVPMPAVSRVEGAFHDFDGDGQIDLLTGEETDITQLTGITAPAWTVPTAGLYTTAAFDFLGDGSADPLAMDAGTLSLFDQAGAPIMTWPREGLSLIGAPVVADIDNDGSAEIVVVSSELNGSQEYPLLQVIGDAEDRWVPARRIWNQHSYHVTNVREDGTIPQVEPKHWLSHNTFRAQAQIMSDGRICTP